MNIDNYLSDFLLLSNIKREALSLSFNIEVIAKAGSKLSYIKVGDNNQLIVSVNAKAIDGKANKNIIKQVSDIFHIAKRQVILVKGEKAKFKLLLIQFFFDKVKTEKYYFNLISNKLKDVNAKKN